MTLRFTLALSFLATYYLLPETGAVALLSLALLAPILRLNLQAPRILERDDLLAAWAYERQAAEPCRQSVLARLSGGEVATLLEACTTLHSLAYRAPENLPTDHIEDWIVDRLRSHRLHDFREEAESVARLMRAIESDSPRPLTGAMAIEECRRLCWSRPELVIHTLKTWDQGSGAVQRFRLALQLEPHRMERLISRNHRKLDQPGLSPAQEVSIFLQLQEPRIREILKAELESFEQISATEADEIFVAEKFVTRLWSILAVNQPVERS